MLAHPIAASASIDNEAALLYVGAAMKRQAHQILSVSVPTLGM
jgi:hypothetical protein